MKAMKALFEVFEGIRSFVLLIFTFIMMWQVAKTVLPGLQVHEDVLKARLSKRFGRKEAVTQRQVDDFIADVTSYVRAHAEA